MITRQIFSYVLFAYDFDHCIVYFASNNHSTSDEPSDMKTNKEKINDSEDSNENNGDAEEQSIEKIQKFIEDLQSNLQECEKKLDEQLQANQMLKAKLHHATQENERISSVLNKQIEDARNFAISGFAKDIINVISVVHLSLQHIEKNSIESIADNSSLAQIIQGQRMIADKFDQICVKNGLQKIIPLGEFFNPDLHEAIKQVTDPAQENGIIIEVVQFGYTLNNRMLVPAMVVVNNI